jgi:hypothetical protein
MLLYGCEIWTLEQDDIIRLKTAEMKSVRRTVRYTLLDRRRNGDTLEEHEMDSVEKKLAQCEQKWLNHVSRMEDIRYPKHLLDVDQSKEEEKEDLDDH